jgi:hypothetical protein
MSPAIEACEKTRVKAATIERMVRVEFDMARLLWISTNT